MESAAAGAGAGGLVNAGRARLGALGAWRNSPFSLSSQSSDWLLSSYMPFLASRFLLSHICVLWSDPQVPSGHTVVLSLPARMPIQSKTSDVVVHYSIPAKPPPIPPTNSSLSPLPLISQRRTWGSFGFKVIMNGLKERRGKKTNSKLVTGLRESRKGKYREK